MNKTELRTRLHALNPYAGYNGDYGRKLTIEQLTRTLARYEALQRGEQPNRAVMPTHSITKENPMPETLTCLRLCDHGKPYTWIPKVPNPRACPNCNSRIYMKPKPDAGNQS